MVLPNKKLHSALLIVGLVIATFCPAQTPPDDVDVIHQTVTDFLKKGEYENATQMLTKGLQSYPDNLQLTKDLLFTTYLKRDFAKAMELGKMLTERSDADVQSFQLLGMTYRSIAEDKEADKLYKKALKLFPNEGVLYAEYGELLEDKQPALAQKTWEKGVEVDPNNPNNYYHLGKQYAQKGKTVQSIICAETFLNMESFTARSTEMKNLLLDEYKVYAGTAISQRTTKSTDPFDMAVEEMLDKQQSMITYGISPESLTLIRTRFILDWYNKYGSQYPFRLFEHQRQLLQEGYFEAYNNWLFGPAINVKAYQTWQQYHQQELNDFLSFIKNKVYKIPEGQQFRPALGG